MSEQQEPMMITLDNEDGSEENCVLLDRLEVDGVPYVVLAPEDDEDCVMVFRVETDEDGAESFAAVEDDDVSEEVFDYFRAAYDDYEFGDAQ